MKPSKAQLRKAVIKQLGLLPAKNLEDLEEMLKLMSNGNTAIKTAIDLFGKLITEHEQLEETLSRMRSEKDALARAVADLKGEVAAKVAERETLLKRNALLAADNAKLESEKLAKRVGNTVLVHSSDR